MQPGQPSRTALGAAGLRAAHQLLDGGRLFSDPLAVSILGRDEVDAAVQRATADPSLTALRMFIAIRSRFAEDALAAAVERGVRQLVILGAGLDTFAYRSPFADRVRIFEVDHPATQEWKRHKLVAADIAEPSQLTFAPIDFEQQTLAQGLQGCGFYLSQQSFFTWLGVVPYLSEEAVFTTLRFIAELPGGGHVVFDYANPSEPDALASRVAAAGEALKSSFATQALHAQLTALGFRALEDLGPQDIAARYLRRSTPRESGGHIVRASTLA